MMIQKEGKMWLSKNRIDYGHCMVHVRCVESKPESHSYYFSTVLKVFVFYFFLQINNTISAFFGGSNNRHGVLTFDWTTMKYTKHSPELTGSYLYSSCALLNGDDGEKLVALVGGRTSPGMEVWNPNDGSVKYLTTDFPPKDAYDSFLVSVNDGEELIFYETYYSNNQKGIWKYFQSNNTWTKIGEMFFARRAFVVLPVTGMSCP